MAYPYNPKIAPAIGNGLGGLPQKASTTATVAPRGEITFAVPGTYYWTPPKGVTSVCVVCVGGGGGGSNFTGGGAGGLGWKNNIPVEFGVTYTVVIGRHGRSSRSGYTLQTVDGNGTDSYFLSTNTVKGVGGKGAYSSGYAGGGFVGDGGGYGGSGTAGGGGGTGGYSGDGGNSATAPASNSGGASGGSGSGGGGVGLFGLTNTPTGTSGQAGSDGQNGTTSIATADGDGIAGGGGIFGGGGQGSTGTYGNGGHGAVRIIWGKDRAFPSTDCGQS